MTNKIGLTFLLAWFAVMAIVANYSYDRNVPYRGNTGDEYASKMCRLDIAYQSAFVETSSTQSFGSFSSTILKAKPSVRIAIFW